MKVRTKTAFEILQVGLIVGILGDVLLRQVPWGLNAFLFNMAFIGGLLMLVFRRKREFLTPQSIALLSAMVFFASMFVWRDSIELRLADTVTIVVILSVLFVPQMKLSARVAGVFHYVVGFLWSALNAFFAPVALLASDIEWKSVPRTGWSSHLISVLRGLFIVTPLLLIFGGLFVAADAVYQGMVQRVFNIEPNILFSHIVLFAVFAWFSAGYLRGLLLANEPVFTVDPAPTPQTQTVTDSKVDQMKDEATESAPVLPNNRTVLEHINTSDPPNAEEPGAETRPAGSVPDSDKVRTSWQWAKIDNTLLPSGFTVGTVEVGIILGLLDLLFLSFVIVQVPYLFGGMDLVQNTPDFKLAEYARRGFGELVAVSALVLPILLLGHWLIRKENPFTEKLFRVLAGIQIALLFVIMASAVQRLVLLTGNLGYGMTTVRLYPMILMTWLAIVFVWFGVTVLRGSRQYFAWGALWSAFFVLGATHFLNPDEFIVKTNIALMQQGREFDAGYNSRLSADSIPALLSALPAMSFQDQCKAKVELHIQYRKLGETSDLRSLNWSRKTAWHMLNQSDAQIHDVEGCPSWVKDNLQLDTSGEN